MDAFAVASMSRVEGRGVAYVSGLQRLAWTGGPCLAHAVGALRFPFPFSEGCGWLPLPFSEGRGGGCFELDAITGFLRLMISLVGLKPVLPRIVTRRLPKFVFARSE